MSELDSDRIFSFHPRQAERGLRSSFWTTTRATATKKSGQGHRNRGRARPDVPLGSRNVRQLWARS